MTEHKVKPLDAHDDLWKCSCGETFSSAHGFAVCPQANLEYVPKHAAGEPKREPKPGDLVEVTVVMRRRGTLTRILNGVYLLTGTENVQAEDGSVRPVQAIWRADPRHPDVTAEVVDG